MSTLSIHPMEYLRLHVYYEEVRRGLRAALGSLAKRVSAPVERAATIAVVLFVAALVIFSFMKIGESASVGASYSNAITEMVHPPLPVMPAGI
jgi:hypothetical protein